MRKTQHTAMLDGGWVERSCTNKVGYKSFAHALEDIPRVQLQYGAGALTGYRCVVCRQWHLSKVVPETETITLAEAKPAPWGDIIVSVPGDSVTLRSDEIPEGASSQEVTAMVAERINEKVLKAEQRRKRKK